MRSSRDNGASLSDLRDQRQTSPIWDDPIMVMLIIALALFVAHSMWVQFFKDLGL